MKQYKQITKYESQSAHLMQYFPTFYYDIKTPILETKDLVPVKIKAVLAYGTTGYSMQQNFQLIMKAFIVQGIDEKNQPKWS